MPDPTTTIRISKQTRERIERLAIDLGVQRRRVVRPAEALALVAERGLDVLEREAGRANRSTRATEAAAKSNGQPGNG